MDNGKITDKPRKPYELAEYYGVDLRTFNAWIDLVPELEAIRKNLKGYYYSINDVKKIIEYLGEN